MVEAPGRPVAGGVAVLALCGCSQRSGMMLVCMARRAGVALGGIALVGMACGASQCGMLAQQGEAGQVVIELDRPGPNGSGMAAPTIAAQLPGMRILLGVAGRALP